MSSANIQSLLPWVKTMRSPVMTTKDAGPMLDPRMLLAVTDWNLRHLTTVHRAVRVPTKEDNQPVADIVWRVQLGSPWSRRYCHSYFVKLVSVIFV